MNINRMYDILTVAFRHGVNNAKILVDLDKLAASDEYYRGKSSCETAAALRCIDNLDDTFGDFTEVLKKLHAENDVAYSDDLVVCEAIYHLCRLRTLSFEIKRRVVKDGRRFV